MSNKLQMTSSQQLVYDLVHDKHVSVKDIAKSCQVSYTTLYLVLSGARDTLRPQTFTKLFRFYLATTIAK